MPIASPIGFLDVVNATLRASQVETTSRLTVANTAATKNFSVGDRFHVDKDSVDPVSVTGNVVASGIKISNLTISPIFDLGAVSNVGNTTSNTLQFANATTSFVASSNVEIGGNITLTSNAQVKVGSNVLAEYTGPHGREPKAMPLKKFPEIAFEEGKFDRNDSTNTYTQAGYTVSGSAPPIQTGRQVWQVFDQKGFGDHTPSHETVDNRYNSGTGAHTGGVSTTVSGTSYLGDWIQVKLPKKIRVKHVNFGTQTTYGYDRVPISGIIAGSTNGSDWTLVKNFTKTSSDFIMGEFTQIDVNNAEYYDYYRFIAVTLVGGDTRYACQELEYYGYEEPAPPGDLSLDTTLKSTFNSVRSNNYVMYFDGEDPAAGNVPKYLPSGSAKSITPNNVVFDATNNCWTLDGSTESNVTTGSLGLEGDAPHTVSTWINASNLEANATTQQLFSIGSGYSEEIVRVDDTQIAANTWHNVTYAYQGEGGSKVTYVDGRKVEEAQVEDTFGDYPPFAMTGYKTGGYVVSSNFENSTEARKPYNAFNATGTGNRWQVDSGYSTSSPFLAVSNGGGLPSITDTNGTAHVGHWLKLELPNKLRLSGFKTTNFIHNQYQLKSYVILGSNDDVNWTLLHSESDANLVGGASGGTHDTGISDVSESFKYLKLLVKSKANGSSDTLMVQQVIFYGHKEGDLTRFPEPTRVLKYPHILTKNGTGDGFTSATSAPEYGKRGYVIKASSSIGSYPPYAAFNGETHVATGTTWIGGYNSYGTNNSGVSVAGGYKTTGAMNLKTNLGTGGSATSNGEWLYIEMPHKIKVTSTKIISNDGVGYPPDYLIIYGTNDPSSSGGWNVVDNTYDNSSSGIVNNATGKTWAVSTASSPVAYKYFALVIVKVNSSATYSHALVTDWQLLGTEEDTGTPAIVGGPFAGKVANFRVYDQYLGDERIQEIYDAQKDEFGHKKSSMTFYKGRIGVGTTEPEGALTVLDEPHALEKFPARAISSNDSYVEGEGETVIRTADGSGYQAFDGLTSTSWTATPTRNTRLSEEVDFGAWLKLQTPQSISLKKAEIESNPDWQQVGSEILTTNADEHFGRAVACSHDGTRIIAGGHVHSSNQGLARVYDWNGTTWEKTTNTLIGTADNDKFGSYVAISGDGNIIAVAAPFEHSNGADSGTIRVYYLVGSTWTILPDSGSLTGQAAGNTLDTFMGSAANMFLGNGTLKLSYDGKTIAMCEYGYDISGKNDVGRVLVYKYSDGAWSYKGTGATQFVGDTADAHFGFGLSMSEDGNCLAIGTRDAGYFIEVYNWDGSSWNIKGLRLSESGLNGNDDYGPAISISNDGNTLAVGARNADLADGAHGAQSGLVFVYHWTGSAWGTPHKLQYDETTDEDFGISVELSGDGKRIIVGASAENSSSGELFTFEYTGTSWIMRTVGVIGANGGTGGHLGYGPDGDAHSVAISRDGSTIVGGELGYDGNSLTNSGRVRVWNMPSNIKSIWGSNDDVNWTKITTGNKTFRGDDRLEFKNLDNPNYYKYHAIVADAFTRLKDVKLFGVRNQGSSTLHDGALTLTKNLDVPRIGPPLDADDTPRRDRLVVEYNTSTNPMEDGLVQDTSGRGNDGAFYGGASYDATEKALVFDGSGDYIKMRDWNYGTGFVHSFSGWVKIKSPEESWTVLYGVGDAPGAGRTNFTIWALTSSNFFRSEADGSGSHIDHSFEFTGNMDKWMHVAVVKSGAAVNTTRMYINGEILPQTGGSNATSDIALPNSPQNFTLGTYAPSPASEINADYSNIKFYDTALTAEEVKTLYDMGRNGSVANPQPLHIAAPLYAPGTIVQVESSTKTDTFSTAGASSHPVSPGNDVPGLAVTIHPKFANSRILVSYTVSTGAYGRAYLRIQRKQGGSTTTIAPSVGVPNSTHGKCTTSHSGSGDSAVDSQSFEYYDTIGGTEPITYQIQAWTYHSSYYIYVNRGHSDGQGNNDGTYWARTLSSITAKEVCQ